MIPKVSIVTPSFNQGEFIGDCISSVLDQQDPNFEHIVMDGASTDNTVAVLESFPHLIYRSEKDNGQSDAVCKALALATGDIVGWINSDDYYYPGAFAAVRKAFTDYPHVDIVTGDYRFVDHGGKVLRERKEVGFDYNVYLYSGKSYLGNAATFFRAAKIKQFGGPRTDLHHCMDYELLLRMGCDTAFLHLSQSLASYRLHEKSKTTTDTTRRDSESLRVRLEVFSRIQGEKNLSQLPFSARALGYYYSTRRVLRKLRSGCYRSSK